MEVSAIKNEIESALADLPPLSPAVLKIVELANDLSASPRDLMNTIKLDPSLTVKILNLVNSAYFSMPQKITSLNRALILLGFNTIKNIALSSAIVEATGSKSKAVEPIWRHLLAVGVTAKQIAQERGQPRQVLEEFFISGLLHDIGDMMLMQFVPKVFEEAQIKSQAEGKSFEEACQELMGIDGPSLGTRVIEHWKLPEIFEKIVQHRKYQISEEPEVVHAVYLADKLVRSKSIGFVADLKDLEINADDLSRNEIESSHIERILEDIPDLIESAEVIISG